MRVSGIDFDCSSRSRIRLSLGKQLTAPLFGHPYPIVNLCSKLLNLNILVPSDFSDISQLALEMAVNAGRLVTTKVHLLHALENSLEHRLWLTGLPQGKIMEFHEKKRAEAEQALHEQLSKTDDQTLSDGVQVHVNEGPPDVVILDAINLLVMGTIARSGIPGALIGNTVERLLPHVFCSVLSLKPDDFQCPIQPE